MHCMTKKLTPSAKVLPKETTSLRLSDEDRKNIAKLKKVWTDPLRGAPSQTEVIQMALKKAVLEAS